MFDRLRRENELILEQGIEILEIFPSTMYTRQHSETYGSSCGGHFRHVIQHYESFFTGLDHGHIDYDHRDRSSAIETDTTSARMALDILRNRFAVQTFSEKPLTVLQNYDPSLPKMPVASSVGRELTFLISHSIHHYAMISIIMRLHQIQPSEYFGFAPSTIYYLESEKAKHSAELVSHTL
jgi:uncharacterized damage-inducible protein DinB